MPVNADIHDIRVIFVDESDDSIRSVSKGSATSALRRRLRTQSTARPRVRDLPITLDKLRR